MNMLTRDRVVADHFRQGLLRQLRQHPVFRVDLPEPRQQQERPGEPLLARVEQLIDQVFFDPDVPRQDVRDEQVGDPG